MSNLALCFYGIHAYLLGGGGGGGGGFKHNCYPIAK